VKTGFRSKNTVVFFVNSENLVLNSDNSTKKNPSFAIIKHKLYYKEVFYLTSQPTLPNKVFLFLKRQT